jgi:hypothetical protein
MHVSHYCSRSNCYFRVAQKRKKVFPGVKKLLEGNPKEINNKLPMDEQTELLPYDKRWEFPRNRLTLGTFLQFHI